IEYLKYNCRSQIFAKSLPMPIVQGALKRLRMVRESDEHRNKLWHNVNMLQKGLRDRGFEIGDTNACVTPVYMEGEIPEALQLVMDMRENYNIFCSIVVYPVIPKGMMLLRLIPTAAHTEEDITITLDAFDAVGKKLNDGVYKKMAEAKKDEYPVEA
ncbi:MAG: aminotransferase class I/II-fold pyridoxal phosphate-dependent enzyme, partial [Saprospiraceae bacterium]